MVTNKRLSVIIPALNEAECLTDMLKELPMDLIYEVIVVDGHSTDGTQNVVKNLGFRCIPQEGRGYGDAVNTGLKASKGELITFMDADASYDPAALSKLIEQIDEGFDVSFCSRYLPESGSDDDTFIRYIGNMFFTFLLRVLHGVKITDSLFLYVVARKNIFNYIQLHSKHFEWCVEFPIKVHNAGLKYTEIPSRERPRLAGLSKVNALLDGLKILWVMVKLKFVTDDSSMG